MTTKKIVYISFLTAIIFTIKLVFGFIDGIEFVTGLILLYALFLPINWSLIISVAFIILTGVFYGMGPWWIMYWFIWPTEVVITWIFKKLFYKNHILFAFWAFFWGFSIILWYSIPNFIIGGLPLVIERFLTGVLVNLLEGTCNFIFIIISFYPIKKLINKYILDSGLVLKKYKENKNEKKE